MQKVSESMKKQVVLRLGEFVDSGSAGGLSAGRSHAFLQLHAFSSKADGAGDGHIAFQSFTDEGFFIPLKGRHYNQAQGGRRLTHVKETQDVVNTCFLRRNFDYFANPTLRPAPAMDGFQCPVY